MNGTGTMFPMSATGYASKKVILGKVSIVAAKGMEPLSSTIGSIEIKKVSRKAFKRDIVIPPKIEYCLEVYYEI